MRDGETDRKKSCSSPLMNLCFSDERGEGSDGERYTHTQRDRVVSGGARRAAPRSRSALRTGSPLGSLSFPTRPARTDATAVESGKVRFNVTHALRPARRSRAERLGGGGRSPPRGMVARRAKTENKEREKTTVRDRETSRKKSCSSPLMNLCFSDESDERSEWRKPQ